MRLLLCAAGLGAMRSWLVESVGTSPKVVFIDVAAQPLDSPSFIEDCRTELQRAGCSLTALDLSNATAAEVDAELQRARAVFVSGGYPINLLEWARRSTFFDRVGEAVRSEALAYIGVSAGAALSGPSLEPLAVPNDPGRVTDYTGLGLVDVVVIPHVNRYPPELLEGRRRDFKDRLDLRALADDRALAVSDDTVTELASA